MIRTSVWVMVLLCSVHPVLAQETERNSAIDRELEAGEDPLSKQQVEQPAKAINTENKEEKTEKKFDYTLYGSMRGRYRHVDGDKSVWEDNGSRLGLNGWYETATENWLFCRYELGFNLLQEVGVNSDSYPGDQKFGDTLFTRLAYVGIQKGKNILAFGKNWSTYYQVAGFTDRFASVGGDASGISNAESDGSSSGTGRADQVIQARLYFDLFRQYNSSKPLAINLQFQPGQAIAGVKNGNYDYGFGVSTIAETWSNINIGIAYNYSSIDLPALPIPELNGLDGNMSALLLGIQWFNENWYLGAIVSRSNNLQTTDKQIYFHGTGVELYTQYQVFPNIWFVGGYNYLSPDTDQAQAGAYLLSYGVLGVRYSIKDFSRMFYLETRLDQGMTSDNERQGNQIIAGIRWAF